LKSFGGWCSLIREVLLKPSEGVFEVFQERFDDQQRCAGLVLFEVPSGIYAVLALRGQEESITRTKLVNQGASQDLKELLLIIPVSLVFEELGERVRKPLLAKGEISKVAIVNGCTHDFYRLADYGKCVVVQLLGRHFVQVWNHELFNKLWQIVLYHVAHLLGPRMSCEEKTVRALALQGAALSLERGGGSRAAKSWRVEGEVPVFTRKLKS
jgi:hypothetical protein